MVAIVHTLFITYHNPSTCGKAGQTNHSDNDPTSSLVFTDDSFLWKNHLKP